MLTVVLILIAIDAMLFGVFMLAILVLSIVLALREKRFDDSARVPVLPNHNPKPVRLVVP